MSSNTDINLNSSHQWVSESPDETQSIATTIADQLSVPQTIALTGPLGAGKTTFVRGIVETFQTEPETVRSPTFTLINQYPSTEPSVVHADLYRTETASAQETIGLEDYFDRGILLVEWADRWTGRWPDNGSVIHFDYRDRDKRTIDWEPTIPDQLPTVDKTVEETS